MNKVRDDLLKMAESIRADSVTSARTDGWLYNVGIAAAIVLNTTATVLPNSHAGWIFLSRLFTGLATAYFAVDRALCFGQRWQHNRMQREASTAAIVRLKAIDAMDEASWASELLSIRDLLLTTILREQKLPGLPTVQLPAEPKPGDEAKDQR